jgi:hypothetical protein
MVTASLNKMLPFFLLRDNIHDALREFLSYLGDVNRFAAAGFVSNWARTENRFFRVRWKQRERRELRQRLESTSTVAAGPGPALALVGEHRAKIMFGVLVVVLRRDGVSILNFSASQHQISLIALFHALEVFRYRTGGVDLWWFGGAEFDVLGLNWRVVLDGPWLFCARSEKCSGKVFQRTAVWQVKKS